MLKGAQTFSGGGGGSNFSRCVYGGPMALIPIETCDFPNPLPPTPLWIRTWRLNFALWVGLSVIHSGD